MMGRNAVASALAAAILVGIGGTAAAEDNAVAPPLQLNTLHPPVPVAPIAPVPAPPSALRFGDLVIGVPGVPAEPVGQINTASAANESQIATYLHSVGVPSARAQSMAAAIVAGAVGGAAIACVAGGTVLFVILGPLSIPLLPFDCAKDIVIGGTAGAVIGAAVGATRPWPATR